MNMDLSINLIGKGKLRFKNTFFNLVRFLVYKLIVWYFRVVNGVIEIYKVFSGIYIY